MKDKLINMLINLFDKIRKKSQQRRYNQFRGAYDLAVTARFNGEGISLYGDGKIKVGDHSYIGSYSTIQASENCEVVIGNFCAISHYVKIYTSTYIADQDFQSLQRTTKSGSVIIGDGVWIGANVFISPGVTIGSNSIIGANSVVVKNVESNSIVSGVPAVFVRYKKI